MAADYTAVRRLGSQIAQQFGAAGDLETAKAIQSLLRKRGVPLQTSGFAETLPRDAGSRLPLVEEGQWPTTPVLLNAEVGTVVAVTSRSNWAKDRSTLSVRRPMEVVVLNCWVTDTKDTPLPSKTSTILAKSAKHCCGHGVNDLAGRKRQKPRCDSPATCRASRFVNSITSICMNDAPSRCIIPLTRIGGCRDSACQIPRDWPQMRVDCETETTQVQ